MANPSPSQDDREVYAVVNNIPASYRSADLRNYFSQFLESGGFSCFHFRHRPELRKNKNHEGTNTVDHDSSTSQGSGPECQTGSSDSPQTDAHKPQKSGTTCCVIRLKYRLLVKFIQMYHRKHWLDSKSEEILVSCCYISKIKVSSEEDPLHGQYLSSKERKRLRGDNAALTFSDIKKLIEMNPPPMMPNGNVGTPTKVFLAYIQQCKLPMSIIGKLGLTFPKTRTNKKYGSVPLEYGGEVKEGSKDDEDLEEVKTGKGKELPFEGTLLYKEKRQPTTKELKDLNIEENLIEKEADSEEDADDCQEWERHEALHDDPFKVEKHKEGCMRKFEEEMEVVWEKGGSGLVFYTDANYWREVDEGDFDMQCADDWDVDMSVYYDKDGGDMDSKALVDMRQEGRRRKGLDATDRQTLGIGKFEKHTKGFGRKVMESQGWTDGKGLGSTIKGIADALDNEGQLPSDKSGFGYHGEKVLDFNNTKPGVLQGTKKRRADRTVIISTVYDDPEESDPPETLLRRNPRYNLKYRDHVHFTKGSDTS